MYRSGIVLIIIVLVSLNGVAQQIDTSEYSTSSKQTQINSTRLLLVGGTLVGAMTAIHIYQQNGWWKDNRAPFHFQEDLKYGLTVDKIGHFYGGAVLGFVMSKSLQWANLPEESALWIGAGGSLLFQSYVEIEDGFSKWGFDRVDWASNLAGALWNPARYYMPYLQNFDLKLSYHPSELIGTKHGIGFQGQKHIMIDDYEGQTFWLSVKVGNLLPERIKDYWLPFLGIAIGYGARDIAGTEPHRVYFLAPDLDMTKIIPDDTPFLKTLGEALNFIHLPLPAVQFAPKTIWYGLYF
ncbi:MAG: DUF2279 domain-containing protein [Ignavibacteriales bacterium]|nr:DUF2279 domain-containing protein [Ignavibacteriales bacterium]